MILTGRNQSTWRQTCPSVTFSITNPSCSDLGLNMGLCSERPVTKHLSHGTAPRRQHSKYSVLRAPRISLNIIFAAVRTLCGIYNQMCGRKVEAWFKRSCVVSACSFIGI
jgi:hypothetical protein